MVDLEIIHYNDGPAPKALLFEAKEEWQEGLHGIGSGKGLGVEEAVVHAEGPYHGDALASLVWELHPHALLDPQPCRGHP